MFLRQFHFNPSELRNIFSLLQILQNLGKADKTTDEIFEEHLQNFNSQQVNATRLHKDINNYLRCIRGQCPIHFQPSKTIFLRQNFGVSLQHFF